MEITKIPKKTVTLITPKNVSLVDKDRYHQKRVAAYCRVSTDSEEQLTSYKTQKKVYTEMIQANKDWTMAGIYADEGISGTMTKNRAEFNKMIKDCYAGKIDYIITKSVSRFARNTVECLEYVRILKARGIGIIFEEQNIDTLKTDSELYLVIYAGFAQSESESISKNITWAKRKSFEEGNVFYSYGNWLGYRKGADGQPEIVPEEAIIVESIFTMFLGGSTIAEIAEKLNEKGYQTKKKKDKWYTSSVLNILRNEKYCGDAILQKTVTIDPINKKHKKNTGEAPMYYVQNAHAPIVSREVFNKAQEELIRRNAIPVSNAGAALTSKSRYSKYALSEVMHCAECGSRYRRVTWVRADGPKVVWRCINRVDNNIKYCPDSATIREEDLHAAIVHAVNTFYHDDSASYKMLLRASLCDALGFRDGAEEISFLTQRIDSQNERMMKMVNETLASGGDIESRDAELKEIAKEIDQLTARIEAIKQAAKSSSATGEARLREITQKIDSWEKAPIQYDDSIVRQLIECIKVYKDGTIEVIFGGGITVKEHLEPTSKNDAGRKKASP